MLNFKPLNRAGILLLVATLFIVIYATFNRGNAMNILKQEPVFKLSINTFGTKYLVKVNGVTVLREFSPDGQLTTTIPINHWMHPKQNHFTLYVLPENPGDDFNPHAYVELGLVITENTHRDQEYSLPILHFHGKGAASEQEMQTSMAPGLYDLGAGVEEKDDGPIQITDLNKAPLADYESAVVYRRQMFAENSLPQWAFFTSDELPDYYAMPDEPFYEAMDSLLVPYMKVQNALASGHIAGILPMFEERNREIDTAFYLEPGSTAQRIKDSMEKNINNPELTLAELKRDYVDITLEENRKLVSLHREGFTSAVGFNFKTGGSTNYDMMFRRENGKWVLTR